MKKLKPIISIFILIIFLLPSALASSNTQTGKSPQEVQNLATNMQKADILAVYRDGLEIYANSLDTLKSGLELALNTSTLELKIARIVASYQETQILDMEAVQMWRKAIDLCGTYSDTQTMKEYLSELVAIYSPLLNYSITMENFLEYMEQTDERNKLQNEIVDKIESEMIIWVQDNGSLSWSDTPSSWAETLVNEAIASGIVPVELQIAYNQPITRAEFCALAVAYYEKVTNQTITKWESFNDTDDRNVRKMAGLGVVSGVGNGNFEPYGTLTREQAATILARLSEALGNPIADSTMSFADVSDISPWAQSAVGQMQVSGIMGGVGGNQFDPQAPYTKEQSIMTVKRMDSRLVPATGLSLVVGKTELNVPADSRAMACITVGKGVTITPNFIPENTTNKTLTWSSSNKNVVSNYGEGIGPGTATVTAITENGISASVTIDVRDNFITDNLPQIVDCVYNSTNVRAGDFSDTKADNNARDAGSIQISDVVAKSYSQNIGNSSKQYCDIAVSGTVSRVRNGLDDFYPYIKLVLKDYDGNILAKKIEGAYAKAKAGDKITIEFTRIEIPDQWGAYSIEFVSDEGKTEDDTASNEPTIKMSQLPFSLTGTTTIENLDTGKAQMIEVETMAINKIEVEITDYDVKSDTYSAKLTCSGSVTYPYVLNHMAPNRISWKLVDSTGETHTLGSFSAPESDYDRNDGVQEIRFSNKEISRSDITRLKSGETYTLILSER